MNSPRSSSPAGKQQALKWLESAAAFEAAALASTDATKAEILRGAADVAREFGAMGLDDSFQQCLGAAVQAANRQLLVRQPCRTNSRAQAARRRRAKGD
jgi:hypothetical protein